MPICSYVVFSRTGLGVQVGRRLEEIPGCSVQQAEGSEVLLLLTETEGPAAEEALQDRLQEVEDLQCLVLTFGEVDGQAPPPRRRRNAAYQQRMAGGAV